LSNTTFRNDPIFGTYYDQGTNWRESTELGDVKHPIGFAKQFVYPFVKNPQADLKNASE
jgi:hypothetical protein